MSRRIRVEFPRLERSCHFLPPIRRRYHDLLANLRVNIHTKTKGLLFNWRKVARKSKILTILVLKRKRKDVTPLLLNMHFLVLGATGMYTITTLDHIYYSKQLTNYFGKARSGVFFVTFLSRQGILSPFSSEVDPRYQPKSPTTKR